MDILGLVLTAQDLNLVWGNIGMTGPPPSGVVGALAVRI